MIRILFYILLGAALTACGASEKRTNDIVIVVSEQAPEPIKIAAEDLKKDLSESLPQNVPVTISSAANDNAAINFYIARFSSIQSLTKNDTSFLKPLNPGARGGLIKSMSHSKNHSIFLLGDDVQGTQYTVYDYTHKILGRDPLQYWTGKVAKKVTADDLIQISERVIKPPVVPYLVYFENDVDELANLKEPMLEYDWESFTQMIDSLVRLRYNGIEFFDMLGRVEFYTRPEYLEAFPGYQLDVEYLNKMMDYVHDKGMYIQIDMMMGRQLLTLSMEQSNCWTKYKQDWIDTWTTYLTETPVKKGDIFALRPRNQVLDWEYKSSCGEDKAEVFNEVYVELGKLIDQYKPGAKKVCTCYHDGMEIFNGNFNPPKDFTIAWSDDGWGTFKYLPEDTKGYKFGTYMHAGFWLNHDVHDPYPELVDETMTMMFKNYNATDYIMVNGQTFRPFMINIEAFAEAARLGQAFDGEAFYRDWVARYVATDDVETVVSAMKQLHEAHIDHVGYVEILWQVKKMTAYLSNTMLQKPGREAVPVDYAGVEKFIDGTQKRISSLDKAVELNSSVSTSTQNDVFFHDHFSLPVHIYRDLLIFNQNLIELSVLKGQYEQTRDERLLEEAKAVFAEARKNLSLVYERRLSGDKDPKWATWYDPAKRRPNNGFPSIEAIEKIGNAIESSW